MVGAIKKKTEQSFLMLRLYIFSYHIKSTETVYVNPVLFQLKFNLQ